MRAFKKYFFPTIFVLALAVAPFAPVYMLENGFNSEAAATWVGAIATLEAVTVALFQQALLNRLFPPSLKVSYVHDIPFIDEAENDSGNKEAYYRFALENDGFGDAKSVEVLVGLQTSEFSNPSDAWVPQRYQHNQNLNWSYKGTNQSDTGTSQLKNLQEGVQRFCDLIRVHSRDGKFWFELCVNVPTFNRVQCLPPGKHAIVLQFIANGLSPFQKIVVIEHSGEWKDNPRELVKIEFRDD